MSTIQTRATESHELTADETFADAHFEAPTNQKRNNVGNIIESG
jgi:hypothetical protein